MIRSYIDDLSKLNCLGVVRAKLVILNIREMESFQCNNLEIHISSLYQTTTSIWKTGHSVLIVDPNWMPHEIELIRRKALESDRNMRVILLFTHADYDHIIGYGAFDPDEVITSEPFASLIDPNKPIQDIRDWDSEHYVQREYPIVYPVSTIIITHDQQTFQQNGLDLELYLTPGHSPDGLAVYIPSQKVLIAGDYLSPCEFPFIEDKWSAYQDTLLKFEQIYAKNPVEWIVPGHGYPYQGLHLPQLIERDLAYLQLIYENPELPLRELPGWITSKIQFWQTGNKQHLKNLSIVQNEKYA